MRFFVLLAAFLPSLIEGRSDGAPQCVKIPGHGVKSQSKDDFDKMYSVSITKSADSDNRWVVKVAGKNGHKFKGFLIRPSWSNQGVLSGGSNGLYRTITDGCEGIDGVTHRDPDEKSEVTVEFTPDESNLKMLNMTLVLVKKRTEVFEERVFTGFAEEGTGTGDRFSSSTTDRSSSSITQDRFETTLRDGQDGNDWNGQRTTTTERFGNGEFTERNNQRTTDRFGNFETTERSNGQDSWGNGNAQRTTDRFGNFETSPRTDQDSWNNNGQRTTDRFGNFETTQRSSGQDSWNSNGQRTTDRFGNFESSTTDRFGRTSTTTTDRYGDEYSDDHDVNSHHADDDWDHINSGSNNNNGWPIRDDRERNPIAGTRTTTTSDTTTSRFTNRVPIPRDQTGSGTGATAAATFALGICLLAIQIMG